MGAVLQDYVPPSGLAGGVSFTDSDPSLGLVSGDVVVTRAARHRAELKRSPEASDEQGVARASEGQKA